MVTGIERADYNFCGFPHGHTSFPDFYRKQNQLFTSAAGILLSIWTRAVVRISMSAGGTAVLTDYGKHDLALTLS